jgi:hypothetical protein
MNSLDPPVRLLRLATGSNRWQPVAIDGNQLQLMNLLQIDAIDESIANRL